MNEAEAEAIKEVFEFLDELREVGNTNMWGAGADVAGEFGYSREASRELVTAWMVNFK